MSGRSITSAALVNLKRGHQNRFESLDKAVGDRYLTEVALGCFSRVKPSESKKTLKEVSRDLFDPGQQFKAFPEVTSMYSYQLLERVLKEHRNLTEDKDNPVELISPIVILRINRKMPRIHLRYNSHQSR